MHPAPANFKPTDRRRLISALGAIVLTTLATPAVFGQTDYPNKPVSIVVAFSPGGPNDVMARILAAKLSANLGQQFIVENKPGAGGTIGTAMVAKAQADGYTLLFNSAPFVTAPALYGSKLSYDTLRDITGITKVAESPLVLMTGPQSAHKSLNGLIAAAKAAPVAAVSPARPTWPRRCSRCSRRPTSSTSPTREVALRSRP
jgi:tripartite-type tricarboxylate transporter receptor subunit TctC